MLSALGKGVLKYSQPEGAEVSISSVPGAHPASDLALRGAGRRDNKENRTTVFSKGSETTENILSWHPFAPFTPSLCFLNTLSPVGVYDLEQMRRIGAKRRYTRS